MKTPTRATGRLLFDDFDASDGLWLMVIANFSQAVVAFPSDRIAPEGMVMFNALICTVLILDFARQQDKTTAFREANFGRLIRKS